MLQEVLGAEWTVSTRAAWSEFYDLRQMLRGAARARAKGPAVAGIR
jgi:hypothetical protein